ncbi:hypothetical protein D3C81_193260 [compost metagenome]|jgi:hypothetical protein
MCFKCDESDVTPDDSGSSESMDYSDEPLGPPHYYGCSPAMEGMMMLCGLLMLCIIFIVVAGVAAVCQMIFVS